MTARRPNSRIGRPMEERVGKEEMLNLDGLERIKVKVAGWKELSLVDIIGEPSFTIWFNYCNLRCPWCQNSHVVTGEVSMEVEVGELIKLIKENAKLVKYVHVTGGEPTLQSEGLEALFLLSKQIGQKTSLSTNGTNFKVIERIIGELDHLALDLKGPLSDPERYARITGSNPKDCRGMVEAIDSSLRMGINNVPFIEVRTTLVPTLLSSEDILNLAEYVSDLASDSINRVVYVIQQYVPSETLIDQKFRSVEKTPTSFLIELGKIVKERTRLKEVYVRAIELGTVKV